MPTRYLFEQVVTIFESNKCVLLDTTYTNQLQKLNYIATCGHTNSVSLKMFLHLFSFKTPILNEIAYK